MPGTQVNDIGLIKTKIEVNFETINLDNNTQFSEVHTISGPSTGGVGAVTSPTLGPYKMIIPLDNSTGAGAPVLKVWLPDPSNLSTQSKMYITYAVKNTQMTDDYYDYQQLGLPSTYKSAISNWIAYGNAPSPLSNNTIKERDLTFTVWGVDTNQQQAAKDFVIRFKWDFSISQAPQTTNNFAQ